MKKNIELFKSHLEYRYSTRCTIEMYLWLRAVARGKCSHKEARENLNMYLHEYNMFKKAFLLGGFK